MAFKKADPKQAFLKIALYGEQGSGKTATSLILAEGIANAVGKRIAYIDTERGTDFYAKEVPQRKWHPQAFDFDALYSRSLLEAIKESKGLNFNEHGVLIVDSISHLWEAAIEAWSGKKTKAGTLPIWAWGQIKKPFKDFITFLMNIPAHVIICGRQGNNFDVNEETGDIQKTGVKMKSEGETAYEPHILVNMYQMKMDKDGKRKGQCVAYFEKDRTGLFTGKSIIEPTYDDFKCLMILLGNEQAVIENDTSDIDAELMDNEKSDEEKRNISLALKDKFLTQIQNVNSLSELQEAWNEVHKKEGNKYLYKTKILPDDLDILTKMKDEKKNVLVDKIV